MNDPEATGLGAIFSITLVFILSSFGLNEYHLHSNAPIQTLEKAQEAIRLLRKYKEPIYHYVE